MICKDPKIMILQVNLYAPIMNDLHIFLALALSIHILTACDYFHSSFLSDLKLLQDPSASF
jgi:hypothetical protein